MEINYEIKSQLLLQKLCSISGQDYSLIKSSEDTVGIFKNNAEGCNSLFQRFNDWKEVYIFLSEIERLVINSINHLLQIGTAQDGTSGADQNNITDSSFFKNKKLSLFEIKSIYR